MTPLLVLNILKVGLLNPCANVFLKISSGSLLIALAFQFARVGKEEGAAKFLHALDSCIGVGGFVE